RSVVSQSNVQRRAATREGQGRLGSEASLGLSSRRAVGARKGDEVTTVSFVDLTSFLGCECCESASYPSDSADRYDPRRASGPGTSWTGSQIGRGWSVASPCR